MSDIKKTITSFDETVKFNTDGFKCESNISVDVSDEFVKDATTGSDKLYYGLKFFDKTGTMLKYEEQNFNGREYEASATSEITINATQKDNTAVAVTNAVIKKLDLSKISNNLSPGIIKNGVTILGIQGTASYVYEGAAVYNYTIRTPKTPDSFMVETIEASDLSNLGYEEFKYVTIPGVITLKEDPLDTNSLIWDTPSSGDFIRGFHPNIWVDKGDGSLEQEIIGSGLFSDVVLNSSAFDAVAFDKNDYGTVVPVFNSIYVKDNGDGTKTNDNAAFNYLYLAYDSSNYGDINRISVYLIDKDYSEIRGDFHYEGGAKVYDSLLGRRYNIRYNTYDSDYNLVEKYGQKWNINSLINGNYS